MAALGKNTECPVCLEVFNQPKVLPCGHCICEKCVDRDRARLAAGPRVVCPICRADSDVPPDGFPTNFALAALVDQISCEAADAKKCVTCAVSLPPKELYVCGDCERRVYCAHCCLDAHQGHQLTKLNDAIEQYNQEKAAWQKQETGRLTGQREQLEKGQARLEKQLHGLSFQLTGRDDLNEQFAIRFNALVGHSQVLQTAVGDACAHEAKLNDDGALPPFAACPIGGLRVRLNTHSALVVQYIQQSVEVERSLTATEYALERLVPQPPPLPVVSNSRYSSWPPATCEAAAKRQRRKY